MAAAAGYAGYAAAKVVKAEAIPGRYIIEIETPAQAATADIKASADKIDAVLARAGISANNIQFKYGRVFPGAADVKDCYGHGTHVAGIIGAAGSTVAGIAPEVTFGVYRIGDCDATIAGDDIFIQAIEKAVGDNMDVISISIGASGRYPWDPVSVAIQNAMKTDVIFSVSAGNFDGRLFTAVTPSTVDNVVSVTAIDNLYKVGSLFTSNVAPGAVFLMDRFAGGAKNDVFFKNVQNTPLVVAKVVADGTRCEVSNLADVAGKVVVFESYDANCGPIAADKIDAAGPKAILYYESDKGTSQFNYDTLSKSAIPYARVWPSAITPLKDALAKGTQVTISGIEGTHVANHPTAGQISWYASRGLAADLTLKPNIAAPGGAIWSTIPVAQGSYGQMGGTSMAAPYISGLIALYLQKYNGSTPKEIHARLQSGARNVLPHYEQATFPGLDSPASVGAGVVNATNFLNYAQPVFTPSQLSLNDTGRPDFKGTYVKTLTLRNNADTPVVFDFSHESAIATTFAEDYLNSPPGIQRFANASASVSFSPSTLSIPSDRSATVAVTITPPSNLNDADLFIYGGWIVATPRQPVPNGIATARAPYAGATNKPLPEGKYRLVARFQRPYTSPDAADSYYTYNSPVFYLKSSRNATKPATGPN
ncbi:subtilisin-like protein [Ramicandelaber brevisporus]|nr:subtilisin-like protein [Ramicandelaber brevisporus]